MMTVEGNPPPPFGRHLVPKRKKSTISCCLFPEYSASVFGVTNGVPMKSTLLPCNKNMLSAGADVVADVVISVTEQSYIYDGNFGTE